MNIPFITLSKMARPVTFI